MEWKKLILLLLLRFRTLFVERFTFVAISFYFWLIFNSPASPHTMQNKVLINLHQLDFDHYLLKLYYRQVGLMQNMTFIFIIIFVNIFVCSTFGFIFLSLFFFFSLFSLCFELWADILASIKITVYYFHCHSIEVVPFYVAFKSSICFPLVNFFLVKQFTELQILKRIPWTLSQILMYGWNANIFSLFMAIVDIKTKWIFWNCRFKSWIVSNSMDSKLTLTIDSNYTHFHFRWISMKFNSFQLV